MVAPAPSVAAVSISRVTHLKRLMMMALILFAAYAHDRVPQVVLIALIAIAVATLFIAYGWYVGRILSRHDATRSTIVRTIAYGILPIPSRFATWQSIDRASLLGKATHE